MRTFKTSHVGLIAGLLFGWVVIHYGVIKAVFLIAMGVAGWFAGRVLDGEAEIPRLRSRDLEEFD